MASPARQAASFPAADEDYFRDMDQTRDGPPVLTPEEIKGRNTWIVWSAGNDRMWDLLGETSVGALDFLKVLSSHPSQRYGRACTPDRLANGSCQNRWEYFGLVNEPCFEQADGARPRPLGPVARPAAGRLRSRSLRERRQVPRRGGRLARPDTERQGLRDRLVLRLRHRHRRLPAVPEPRLRRARRRPLGRRALLHRSVVLQRQGPGPAVSRRACRAACATSGPNPIRPPADPNNPEWANLSSNVGAQYFWTDRIFYEAADLLELRLPAVPLVAARIARHLVRLDRQHQQPADDERGLRAAAAAAARPALGPGNAGRRRPRQQAVQRLREGGPLAALFASPDTV